MSVTYIIRPHRQAETYSAPPEPPDLLSPPAEFARAFQRLADDIQRQRRPRLQTKQPAPNP